jgi:hypothetical protein
MNHTNEALDAWLDSGDAPEADWAPYILKRALRGQLGDGGPGLILDLPPLQQPYACRTSLCRPGMRSKKARSCCADLTVSVSDWEQAAITAALPEIATTMAADPRWKAGSPAIVHDGTLCRPGRRCVFAFLGSNDMSCALHAAEDNTGVARGSIKPFPCRLFPLAVVDLGEGRRLLTAVHRDTATLLGTRPARVFPCLSAAATPLFVAERATITEIFGASVYECIEASNLPT